MPRRSRRGLSATCRRCYDYLAPCRASCAAAVGQPLKRSATAALFFSISSQLRPAWRWRLHDGCDVRMEIAQIREKSIKFIHTTCTSNLHANVTHTHTTASAEETFTVLVRGDECALHL